MLSNHRGFPRSVFTSGLAGLIAVFLFTFSPPGRGATILFTASDVADTTPGQDLWQYSYTPGGFTFAAGQGFTVVFDRTLFTLLQSPPPFVNADWDPLTLQPDLALGSNGFYDAQAVRNNPSIADPFKLRFVWLGPGGTTPGAQPYTVYNADFTTQSQGQTVPEPSPMLLVLAVAVFRVARSSRALVAASRRDELPKTSAPDRTSVPDRAFSKVRFGGTPKPTLGTEEAEGTSGGWRTGEPSVLPGTLATP